MNPDALLTELPIVAILRGVTPARILGVAEAIFGAGIRAIEVPLNSPEPLKSIELLAGEFGDRCLTGAGNMKEWRWAGATGFGLGSELFKIDFSDEDIATRARQMVAAFKASS